MAQKLTEFVIGLVNLFVLLSLIMLSMMVMGSKVKQMWRTYVYQRAISRGERSVSLVGLMKSTKVMARQWSFLALCIGVSRKSTRSVISELSRDEKSQSDISSTTENSRTIHRGALGIRKHRELLPGPLRDWEPQWYP